MWQVYEYTGKQPLEHFINQMKSLLRSSGVPFKFWTTYFKQQCQKDSRAYDALAEAETSFAATLGSDPSKTTEDQYKQHYEQCIKTLQEKLGIPRDQQIRELLSVYHTMTQQPNESVADFAHRFSETQHELDKLIPGIHKTAGKEIELIFAFVNKLRSEKVVQDPHSESEIDAKIQQQLVFKFYISELLNYLQFRYLYTRAFVIQN